MTTSNNLLAQPNCSWILMKEILERYGAIVAFSTRLGGVSKAPFDSLNFSKASGDDIDDVNKNLELFSKSLGFGLERLVILKQIHSDIIIVADPEAKERQTADAVIAVDSNLMLGIKTADCIPVMLIDPITRMCAAVHAGRVGTSMGITRKTVSRMVHMGVNPANLIAVIGPGIGRCCYEINGSIAGDFIDLRPELDSFLTRSRDDANFCLDLKGANIWDLVETGVCMDRIHNIDLCTACRKDLFFSYRRDGGRTGRHLSVVGFAR